MCTALVLALFLNNISHYALKIQILLECKLVHRYRKRYCILASALCTVSSSTFLKIILRSLPSFPLISVLLLSAPRLREVVFAPEQSWPPGRRSPISGVVCDLESWIVTDEYNLLLIVLGHERSSARGSSALRPLYAYIIENRGMGNNAEPTRCCN